MELVNWYVIFVYKKFKQLKCFHSFQDNFLHITHYSFELTHFLILLWYLWAKYQRHYLNWFQQKLIYFLNILYCIYLHTPSIMSTEIRNRQVITPTCFEVAVVLLAEEASIVETPFASFIDVRGSEKSFLFLYCCYPVFTKHTIELHIAIKTSFLTGNNVLKIK